MISCRKQAISLSEELGERAVGRWSPDVLGTETLELDSSADTDPFFSFLGGLMLLKTSQEECIGKMIVKSVYKWMDKMKRWRKIEVLL